MSPNVEHPRDLIPELCRQMYAVGWNTGTGGGISIANSPNEIYIAPSGVQKERIKSEDLFVIDIDGNIVTPPTATYSDRKLKLSECTPLFLAAYRMREAGAVIHSHSINAVLATFLSNGKENGYDVLKVSHQEMIKGIKKGSTNESHRYYETLVVPIIENTPFECDLTSSLEDAIRKFPDTNAVLVKRHGIYVWGKTWQAAKSMAECYDYLFQYAVELKKLGIPLEPSADPDILPKQT